MYLSDLKVDARARILAKDLAAALAWLAPRAAQLALDFEELQR